MADSVWKTRPKGGAWALGVPPAPPRGPFGVCATREGQRGADFGGMPLATPSPTPRSQASNANGETNDMAACDGFLLDLEPMDTRSQHASLDGPQQLDLARAPADTAAPWRLKAQQQQPKEQWDEGQDGAHSTATSSPGCSFSTGAEAALASSLLDLQDDACSASRSPMRQHNGAVAVTATNKSTKAKTSAGAALVASTFWDDLAAKGSLFEYCRR
ncbi:hypothetical protein D9Q98_000726 [Chlorella vulgaris]|uniref:Uncharacterized protein n=1 Tax=Chlorella vulgaris TaxID=3077 RepID=A0A9D4Z272_CHLVU|nr:hypothetical protein D9Q98_000726 [Chlorella vulgaris]